MRPMTNAEGESTAAEDGDLLSLASDLYICLILTGLAASGGVTAGGRMRNKLRRGCGKFSGRRENRGPKHAERGIPPPPPTCPLQHATPPAFLPCPTKGCGHIFWQTSILSQKTRFCCFVGMPVETSSCKGFRGLVQSICQKRWPDPYEDEMEILLDFRAVVLDNMVNPVYPEVDGFGHRGPQGLFLLGQINFFP